MSEACHNAWELYLTTFSVHVDDVTNDLESNHDDLDLPWDYDFRLDEDTMDVQSLISAVPQIPPDARTEPEDPKLRYYETYLAESNAGQPLSDQQLPTEFEKIKSQRAADGLDLPWAPFDSQMEWELAKWLHKSVNHSQIEEFLKLEVVCFVYLIQIFYSINYWIGSAEVETIFFKLVLIFEKD
jgi:hypothetical protein